MDVAGGEGGSSLPLALSKRFNGIRKGNGQGICCSDCCGEVRWVSRTVSEQWDPGNPFTLDAR